VRISARKGLVVVRSGKGDAYREVELNALVHAMLDEWVTERSKIAARGETSFFVSRTGNACPRMFGASTAWARPLASTTPASSGCASRTSSTSRPAAAAAGHGHDLRAVLAVLV
jgi:hypothetical protein